MLGVREIRVAVCMYCFLFSEPPSSKMKDVPVTSRLKLEGVRPNLAKVSVAFQVLQVTTRLSWSSTKQELFKNIL